MNAIFTDNKRLIFISVVLGMLSGCFAALILIKIHSVLIIYPGFSKSDIAQFLCIAIGYVTFFISSDYALCILSHQSVQKLQLDLSTAMLASPLENVETQQRSTIATVFERDVSEISTFIQSFPKAIVDMFTFLGCLAYLAYLSVSVLSTFLVFCVIIVALYFALNRVIHRKFLAVRNALTPLNQSFFTLIAGIKEIQLFSKKRDYILNQTILSNENRYERDVRGWRLSLFSSRRLVEIKLYLFLGCFLFISSRLIPTIDTAILTGLVFSMLFVVKPIESLLRFVSSVSQFSNSLKTINQIQGNLISTSPSTPDHLKLHDSVSSISLSDISHTYYSLDQDKMFKVGPISLTFNSGEISFIVGGNGSGKTTLSKLLCGLYVSQNGAYAINGDCISPTQISTYRNQFSAIFSDFHLFESVIPANTHVPEHVNELIDLFQLRHKVTFENGRFSTQALSTGQRKRLALIVALLEDKPIYIFDEWASDQDPEFKQIFYEKILLELKKRHKILIVITHDDHYFNCADRIIRLRNGQLSTDTTPKVSEKLRHLEVGLNR